MRKSIYFFILTIIFTAVIAWGNFPNVAASGNAPTSAGMVRTSGGTLNVRAAASTDSNIVSSLRNGTYISIYEQNGNFYKVLYASGKVGYCHKNYIDSISGSYGAFVNTASTSLNVRSGPSTSHGIINSLYKGEPVVVLSAHGGFYKILYRGTKIGYASSAYISGAISLSIPDFKQYDSRWKNIRLGSSSKTIYQSGCLTTAIAMEHSFAYGYTVTPDTVAKNSSYTSGGSIYWPTAYGFITGSDYLNRIHSLLKQGKPVIVGATNRYGGQHWVIVTGYTPKGSVSADDFTINDPGSSVRKSLDAFFDSYPNFYKAAYRK